MFTTSKTPFERIRIMKIHGQERAMIRELFPLENTSKESVISFLDTDVISLLENQGSFRTILFTRFTSFSTSGKSAKP